MTGVRHALSVGKKLRARDSATSAPEMLPSPEAFSPYNAAGLLWTGGEEVEKRAVRSRLRLVDMTDTNTDNS